VNVSQEFRARVEYLADRQADRDAQATVTPPRRNLMRTLEAAVYQAYVRERQAEEARADGAG
jgi:hypothetical protein